MASKGVAIWTIECWAFACLRIKEEKITKAYSTIVKQIKECCAEEIVEYIISVNPAGDGTENG